MLFDIIKCGVQILTDETDETEGSDNEIYGDEDDLLDTHESDEASDIEEEDYDSIGTSGYESGETSDTEDDEDGYKSEEKDKGMGDEDDYESVSRNHLRKTSVPIDGAFSSQPMVPFTFPDSSAALNAPRPPPTYGFHMLEQRTIALTDGSVHSYFALPPNYQDSPPPFHLEEFRDQQNHWDRPECSMKRKYPHEEEIGRAEMLRQSQQFMNYADPNDQSVAGTSSSPFLRDVGEDDRAAKHMRIGPC